MLSLWLKRCEADFLRGQFLSVNWDADELVAHRNEIEDGDLLKSSGIRYCLAAEELAFQRSLAYKRRTATVFIKYLGKRELAFKSVQRSIGHSYLFSCILASFRSQWF